MWVSESELGEEVVHGKGVAWCRPSEDEQGEEGMQAAWSAGAQAEETHETRVLE